MSIAEDHNKICTERWIVGMLQISITSLIFLTLFPVAANLVFIPFPYFVWDKLVQVE